MANVIREQDPTTEVSAGSAVDANSPTGSTGGVVQTAQSLLGFLIAGIAAILSFIGIKSTELASILRNQETNIGVFVALPLLFGIITAILSTFKARATQGERRAVQGENVRAGEDDTAWPTNRFAIASLLLIFAVLLLLPGIPPITFTTTLRQQITSFVVGGVVGLAALYMMFRKGGWTEIWGKRGSWVKRPFDIQLYLILASVLFLAISVFAALRLESASQATSTAQLGGSVTVDKNSSAVLSLAVAATKVPVPDRIDVTVTALPRTVTLAEICRGTKGAQTPLNYSSCAANPCSYRPLLCPSLAGWGVPPDATGAVREILTLPFSSSMYQRLHIQDSLCERSLGATQCTDTTTGSTHLDIQVPAPPP